MIRSIIIAVLSVALIGTAVFAYNEHQEKENLGQQGEGFNQEQEGFDQEQLAINNENNYQRSFNQLAFHLDHMQDELGASLATNGLTNMTGSLAEVWRISSMAHSEMGHLPLGIVPIRETEQYLSNVAEFTHDVAIRDRADEPLTDEEYEQLETFYEQAGEISQDLRTVQAKMQSEDIRWTDIEAELVSNTDPGEGTAIDGLQGIDEKAKGFSENNWNDDTGFPEDVEDRIASVVDDETALDEEEVVEKAKDFLNLSDEADVEVDRLGEGLPYEGYQIMVDDNDGESKYRLNMTEKGGLPIWALQDRPISDEVNVSLNEASDIAADFLEDKGFEDLQLVDSKQYNSVGTFQFAPTANDVRLYPDAVVMEVALDDGDIIGYKGSDYIANHRERHDLEPEIDLEEALDEVHENLEVREDHMAVIENQNGDEVLTYELYGTMNNDTYRLYINAEDGTEEEVKRMQEAEPIYHTM
ncbi:spore germination protein [Geomicrobium halophilum]|uniref:Spore germination protein n=1 Tax=Geomicrobium halophilum TaxID=549000 RepID=A0A841PP86_9BACL|nr:germination protein YpeB [Geomicrobium halophilum]MBB6449016.1 spore germination protein [Geomicrobium halophilum]